jgi:CRISPR-associated endoribonuclease Cas6
MPTALTIQLTAATPLFFDPGWPLAQRFLEILARGGASPPEGREALKPYALSPVWRTAAPTVLTAVPCRWRVCLLDDALTAPFLEGLKATDTLDLNGTALNVGEVAVETCPYDRLVRQAQQNAQARPGRARHLNLEFRTPTLLYRSGLPLPLPDPLLVFRHYLSVWDTFAPRELWVNFNRLDAVQFHVTLTRHHLETRRVRGDDGHAATGFVGRVSYAVREWHKLGAEFLGTLQTLAQFGTFCGTGAGTTRGLGQTRLFRGQIQRS